VIDRGGYTHRNELASGFGQSIGVRFPMTFGKLPPTARLDPVRRDPVIPRARGDPALSGPDVPVSIPKPVPRNPDIPGARRWFRDHSWWRGSDRYRASVVSGRWALVDVTSAHSDDEHYCQ